MSPTRLQLEGPSLEELLGRVQREHGAVARILQAEKVRTGGVGGFFAREVYRIDVEVAPRAASPSPLSLLDLADAVSDTEVAVAAPAVPSPRPPLRRPTLSTESPTFAAVLAGLAADAEPEDEFVPLPGRRAKAARPVAAPAPEETVAPVPAPTPTPMLLRALPAPDPVGPESAYVPGQVVVVAGELQLALRAVQAVARELGVDRPDLYVASTDPVRLRDVRPARRLMDPARAGAVRARWARRDEASFVVIDAPLLLRPEGWARALLDALAADMTWGAVSATTKVADIDRWAGRLGIDLLSVHDLEATVDASELLAGVRQVGLVDGVRPAPAPAARRVGRGRGVA